MKTYKKKSLFKTEAYGGAYKTASELARSLEEGLNSRVEEGWRVMEIWNMSDIAHDFAEAIVIFTKEVPVD